MVQCNDVTDDDEQYDRLIIADDDCVVYRQDNRQRGRHIATWPRGERVLVNSTILADPLVTTLGLDGSVIHQYRSITPAPRVAYLLAEIGAELTYTGELIATEPRDND